MPVAGRDVTTPATAIAALHPVMAEQYRLALDDAEEHRHQPFPLEDAAGELLDEYYAMLAALPGVAGRLCIRMATIAARIALVHAALDLDGPIVRREHAERAIALVEYCRSGLNWVFGAAVIGSADAQRILQVLITADEPLTRSQLGDAAWRKSWNADRLDAGLAVLRTAGMVEITRREASAVGGRPAQVIRPLIDLGSTTRFSRARPEGARDAHAHARERIRQRRLHRTR